MTEGRMIPVNVRTRAKILTYLNEWHGEIWSLHTKEREGIAQRIAENVTAYFRYLNVLSYTRVAQEMLNDGTIQTNTDDGGQIFLTWETKDSED